jgi:hypothetical protein
MKRSIKRKIQRIKAVSTKGYKASKWPGNSETCMGSWNIL